MEIAMLFILEKFSDMLFSTEVPPTLFLYNFLGVLGVEVLALCMLHSCCCWGSPPTPWYPGAVLPAQSSLQNGTYLHVAFIQSLAFAGNCQDMSENVCRVTSVSTQSGSEREHLEQWRGIKIKHTPETGLSTQEPSNQVTRQIGFTQKGGGINSALERGRNARAFWSTRLTAATWTV